MAASWSFLSTHGRVLIALTRDPELRLRDIAVQVGITERAAQNIVNELVDGGYLERTRVGRRNRYLVRGDRPLPDSMIRMQRVAELARVMVPSPGASPTVQDCEAVVISCSDHGFQEQLRRFLGVQGLLDRAEVLLWPGAPWALGSPDGPRILRAAAAVAPDDLRRVLLVAHRGCRVPGQAEPADGGEPLRSVVRRLGGSFSSPVQEAFGTRPEVWFLETGERRRRPS